MNGKKISAKKIWRYIVVFAGIVGVLTGLLINIDQIITIIFSRPYRDVAISYTRLFGAYQVPYILDSQNKIFQIYSESELIKFHNKWNSEVPNFLKTKAWDEVITPHMSLDLLKIACKNVPNCNNDPILKQTTIFSGYDDWSISLQGVNTSDLSENEKREFDELFLPGKYPAKRILERVKELSNNIGFLILILQNTSKKALHDIKFEYTEYLINSIGEHFPSSQHVENELKKSEELVKFHPLLNPDQKLLLLLSVYFKDNKGYPKAYIASVMRPFRISYNIDGSDRKLEIRLPKKEEAMKRIVPLGWADQ